MADAKVTKLFDEREIAARVEEIASKTVDHLPRDFLIVGLLVGSFVFVADLIRALYRIGCTPSVEFIRLSSYSHGQESSSKCQTPASASRAAQMVMVVSQPLWKNNATGAEVIAQAVSSPRFGAISRTGNPLSLSRPFSGRWPTILPQQSQLERTTRPTLPLSGSPPLHSPLNLSRSQNITFDNCPVCGVDNTTEIIFLAATRGPLSAIIC
jgi:hypothetical protein